MTAPAVQVGFYRSLYSQSAASVTAGCVAAALHDAGCETSQVLLNKGAHSNARTLLSAKPTAPTILLFKPNFQDIAESLPMVDSLRRNGSYAGLYLFGVYATLNAEVLLEMFPGVDGVLRGEPEMAALALWRVYAAGGSPCEQAVAGVLARDSSGDLVDGGPAPVLSMVDYIRPRRDIEKSEAAALANLEASRGCIAACTFCHVPVFASAAGADRRRVRPVHDVVDEMVHLRQELGKRYLVFNDGLFWSGPRDDERLAEFISELRSRPAWDGEFMVYLRTNPMLSPVQLKELASVGLIRVFIGVESESDETLKLYRKGAKGDAYDGVKRLFLDAGISHHIGFLMFHPFVRLSQLRRDVDFLDRHDQLHRLGVIMEPARLVPGSGLKAQVEQAGLLRAADPLTGDSAYAYEFADPQAGRMFTEVRAGLRTALAGRHKALEYFHTSSEFLEFTLRRRLGHGAPLAMRPKALRDAREDLRSTMRRYLECVADCVEEMDVHDRGRAGIDAAQAELTVALRELVARTEAEHAQWFDQVSRRGHGDLVAALFTSEEGA